MKPCVLVTGGTGFFGGILKAHLLQEGYSVVSVDRIADDAAPERLTNVTGDIRDAALMDDLFRTHRFACVFHIAAIMAHDRQNRGILWSSNADATRLLKELCERYGVGQLVFTSSNCLWAKNFVHPVTEEEPPAPVEIYGRSKLAAEQILLQESSVRSVILRCPTIVDTGRLGLLTILFDFIREGRKVWTVGGGHNRYQFIYAQDLVRACMRAMDYPRSSVFNIGSDRVPSLRETFQYVIDRASTPARVASLPKFPTLLGMKALYWLGLSPLGPYHYRMVVSQFVFDTSRIKRELNWSPTLTNGEMLWQAYADYVRHLQTLTACNDKSASIHRRPSGMGVIRLLKWIS